jgi:hypothetical protein
VTARERVRRSPIAKAHLSLWILILVSVLMAGSVSAAAAAPPSPTAGVLFAFSAILLVASLTLAGRVTMALERARRLTRPPQGDSDSTPVLNWILQRTRGEDHRRMR